ncbi:MAG: hypothetical protein CL928_09335 [Deltaproteobacteria bacterium]|nr:hypothetical protein [Deltaproteobacteria bacterium]
MSAEGSPPQQAPEPLGAPTATLTGRSVAVEVLVLYLGSCFVIRLIKEAVNGWNLAADWLVLVALVFFYTPVVAERFRNYRVPGDVLYPEGPIIRLRRIPLLGGREFSFQAPQLRTPLLWWGIVVLLIYPVFIPGYHLWQSWGFNRFTIELLSLAQESETLHWLLVDVLGMWGPYPRFHPDFAVRGFPPDLALIILYQLICVGYAEEYFYRGYMQTRLDSVFRPDRFQLFGAKFGWSLPVVAVLFTLGHALVEPRLWQPFILFPALLFGWLRARTGNVLAATLFHAWANTVMIVLDHIYGITSAGS